MVLKPRGQIITPTDSVQLVAQFRDQQGEPADPDAFPQITITQPNGGILLGPTSAGVFRIDVGKYGFIFSTGVGVSVGVWSDSWEASLDGIITVGSFNFVVYPSQMPVVNSDGYIALGDDVPFNYSQNALLNINKVIKVLKARLKSSGKSRTIDEFGNAIFHDCDIFSIDQLATFAASSLTLFNEIPHFSQFSFEDTNIIDSFLDIIAQGATLMALSSQALIERGREFSLTDNSIGFSPPTISELLNTQFGTELANHMEKIKLIKWSMKPAPMGLGSMRTMGAGTSILKLRFLRARQII